MEFLQQQDSQRQVVVYQKSTYLVGVHVKRIDRQVVSGQVQTLEDFLEGEISGKGRCRQLSGSRR
jgi:hypothetical protein